MPKMTPEIFSKLDPEQQLELLKDIPIDQLNNVYYLSLDPNDTKGSIEAMVEIYESIPEEARFPLVLVLLEMFYHAGTKLSEQHDIEMPPKLVAMSMTLVEAISRVREYAERDDDDET